MSLPPSPPSQSNPSALSPFALALALSLGAAVSLGITRFAYGLLLPPMKADLQWSYTLAGGMNTANALGYLLGALVAPRLIGRHGASRVLVAGSALASVFMGLSGFFIDAGPLLLQRVLAGVASALLFVAGGLLAARLGAVLPRQSGLLLGIYYGGTGLGIVLSALLVPVLLEASRDRAHGWAWAWWALSLACLGATLALLWPARAMQRLERAQAQAVPELPSARAAGRAAETGPAKKAGRVGEPAGESTGQSMRHGTPASDLLFRWRAFAPALAGYAMFGVGYIGYMTFVIALLRELGVEAGHVTWFYALLGVAVMASPIIWAGLLDRHRSGRALALLNALLGVSIVIPALTSAWPLLLASGLLFGGVFLSVVASTTALVRHSLPPSQWAAGISAFTVVFAAGQIAGPTAVGWIADGPGGLARGLLFSAGALWLGALLASRQRALPQALSLRA